MLTYRQYLSRAARLGGYWSKNLQDRWLYLSAVAAEAALLSPATGLEVGTHGVSLLPFSDTLDCGLSVPDNPGRQLYRLDATTLPWPMEDGQYDVVIGCQVLEHLGPHHADVFREMCRVGRNLLLTLPYQWHCPGDLHHGVDDAVVADWTAGRRPFLRRIIGSKPFLRLLLGFRGQ